MEYVKQVSFAPFHRSDSSSPTFILFIRECLDVAVKEIRRPSAEVKDELLKEAAVMASLDHTNVVRFLGICLPLTAK